MSQVQRLAGGKGRKLLSSTTAAATASTSAIVFPSDWIGGKFYFDVTAASGTSPTLDFSIETTIDDGTTWIVCWRSAQITSAADYEIQTFWGPNSTSDTDYHTGRVALATTGGVISLPTPISDKIRITYTIGGTNPSFTFSVSFLPWRKIAGGF